MLSACPHEIEEERSCFLCLTAAACDAGKGSAGKGHLSEQSAKYIAPCSGSRVHQSPGIEDMRLE